MNSSITLPYNVHKVNWIVDLMYTTNVHLALTAGTSDFYYLYVFVKDNKIQNIDSVNVILKDVLKSIGGLFICHKSVYLNVNCL